MITANYLKRAWIRNADAPVGFPAPGHINCPCGNSPESEFKPEQGDVTCACGAVYTWDGWIKQEAPRVIYIGKIPAEKYIAVTTSIDCLPADTVEVTTIRNLSLVNVVITLKDGYPDYTVDVNA